LQDLTLPVGRAPTTTLRPLATLNAPSGTHAVIYFRSYPALTGNQETRLSDLSERRGVILGELSRDVANLLISNDHCNRVLVVVVPGSGTSTQGRPRSGRALRVNHRPGLTKYCSYLADVVGFAAYLDLLVQYLRPRIQWHLLSNCNDLP
jgi:hypothetical protein